MRVLITGNMGYAGPAVTRHLRGVMPLAYLAGYDSGFFAHCLTTTKEMPERLLDEQRFGDVRKIEASGLEGFDTVVHLAAVSNDPMGNRFEAVTDAINHRASVAIAEAAAAAGVKSFVFASSCSVYGFAGDGRARAEGDARSRYPSLHERRGSHRRQDLVRRRFSHRGKLACRSHRLGRGPRPKNETLAPICGTQQDRARKHSAHRQC
jgi:nucleoside-diphosphate-sugar epimerase